MHQESDSLWERRSAELNLAECALVARSMIVARRALHDTLPSAFIHDAALDILLHLFLAYGEGRAMSEDDIERATTAERPVALRWLAALQKDGLVDGSIALSDAGVATMTETLRAVSRSQWDIH